MASSSGSGVPTVPLVGAENHEDKDKEKVKDGNNDSNDNIRKFSNASSSMGGVGGIGVTNASLDSDTGRLLNSLGSVSSSLAAEAAESGAARKSSVEDEAAAMLTTMSTASAEGDSTTPQFKVPASVPQHHHSQQLKFASSEEPHIHSSLPKLSLPAEENGSLSGSKGSVPRHLPERRLPSKKRKMSYESYDSAMGDSCLGLATLDSGIHGSIIPKLPDVASVATKGSGHSDNNHQHHMPLPAVSALDHLDALGHHEGHDHDDLPAPAPVVKIKPPDEGSANRSTSGPAGVAAARAGDDHSDGDATFTSSGHRILMEAIMMTNGGAGGGTEEEMVGRRKRFESWGGMSDLSVHMGGPDQAAAAIAASALHHTGILGDVTAAANLGGGSVASSVTDDHPPNNHSSHHKHQHDNQGDDRDRTASFSDSTFPVPASLEGLEISSDLQKFVAQAVASVGDELAELAGNIESAAAAVDLDGIPAAASAAARDDDTRHGSEVSSIATPLVGASLDEVRKVPLGDSSSQPSNPDKSVSAGISVDYDAVAAAVEAANAATGDLDLSAIEGAITIHAHNASTASSISSGGGKSRRKRKLPMHNRKPAAASISAHKEVPKSLLSERAQEEMRERARKAAGYVPPSHLTDNAATPSKQTLPPIKKRRRMTPEPASSSNRALLATTPKVSNMSIPIADHVPSIVVSSPGFASPAAASSRSRGTKGKKEKSTQKWESMFDAMIQFIQERKEEETAGLSGEAIADWTWDGNVPTTYKTKDGLALGRWVNNQRSAKTKGTLREDREIRLVNAGLKWSVMTSSNWNDMLEELRIYIKEYTKDGKKWDGNVPTNYKIKPRANGRKLSDEDKNLGRWVNRQRNNYQSGKLRADRQLALEALGLRWSMLCSNSWEAMYNTLVEYVRAKEAQGVRWDGNVPATYKTDDDPPKALGRWINRQRSAHGKNKLKQENVQKLSNLGLKWSFHERGRIPHEPGSNRQLGQQAATAVRPLAAASANALSSRTATIPSTIAVPAKQSTKTKSAANAKLPAPPRPTGPVPDRVSSVHVHFDDEKKDDTDKVAAAVVVDHSVKIVAKPAPSSSPPPPQKQAPPANSKLSTGSATVST